MSLTIQLEPLAPGDDGFYNDGPELWVNNTDDLSLGYHAGYEGNSHLAVRFPNVTIPRGSTIVSAFFRMIAALNSDSNNLSAKVQMENADDSAPIAGTADYLSRVMVPFFGLWSALPAWTSGNSYTTFDIDSLVQAVINRAGWSSGNAMAVYLQSIPTFISQGTNVMRQAAAFEHATLAPPRLTITYDPPPARTMVVTW